MSAKRMNGYNSLDGNSSSAAKGMDGRNSDGVDSRVHVLEYNGIDAQTESTPLIFDAKKIHQHPHPHFHHDDWSSRHHYRTSKWRFWSSSSPSYRFWALLLATFIPFGGHVVKASISPLGPYLLHDKHWSITHTQFGAFQSAVSLPNLVLPLLGGLWLDIKGTCHQHTLAHGAVDTAAVYLHYTTKTR